MHEDEDIEDIPAAEEEDANAVELTEGHVAHRENEHHPEPHEETGTTLPVAYATPLQKCFESEEFDFTDDSEEWSG